MSLEPEFYNRLLQLLETLNLRGQRCPMCYQPRPEPCTPGCELKSLLLRIRST